MPRTPISHFLNPWARDREKARVQLDALRARDGDDCRRCRRPMRFDLPRGHDQGPAVEHLTPLANGGSEELANLCLCHGRCNPAMKDSTPEVLERLRMKAEAALLAGGRKGRKRAASAD